MDEHEDLHVDVDGNPGEERSHQRDCKQLALAVRRQDSGFALAQSSCREGVKHQENEQHRGEVERDVPERGNHYLEQLGGEVETVHDNHGEHGLHVVHEPGEHPDESGENDEERGVYLDLPDDRSRGLHFPDHVEVRFEAPEREDEGDE